VDLSCKRSTLLVFWGTDNVW